MNHSAVKLLQLEQFAFVILLLFSLQAAMAAEVRISVPASPFSLPFFVAAEKGYFEKYGILPKITICNSSPECLGSMTEKRVDFAASSELPLMFLAFENSPISIVATFAANKSHQKLLALGEKLKDPSWQWEGKRIGYVPETASHYYKDLFLLFNGIEPKRVVEVPMRVEELPGALLRGHVDAISVWEPWIQKTMSDQTNRVVAVDSPNLYTQTFNLSVHNDFKKLNPAQVKAVLRALGDAIDHIDFFPLRSKAVMARHLKLSREYVDQIWNRYMFRLELQKSLLSTLNGQAQWAMRENHLQGNWTEAPNFTNIIDASFLREYQPEQVDQFYR